MFTRTRTYIRNRVRRWLGIPAWEQLQLEEVRELRSLNDSYQREVQLLRDRTESLTTTMTHERSRHNSVRREVEELGILARSIRTALGGVFWTTASGFTRPIALLSDTHLDALVRNGFARGEVLEAVQAEQERRLEDDKWAARQGTYSLRDRVARLEGGTPTGDAPHTVTETDREVLLSTIERNLEQVRDQLQSERTGARDARREAAQKQLRIDELERQARNRRKYL